jgi:hypothetical protein
LAERQRSGPFALPCSSASRRTSFVAVEKKRLDSSLAVSATPRPVPGPFLLPQRQALAVSGSPITIQVEVARPSTASEATTCFA